MWVFAALAVFVTPPLRAQDSVEVAVEIRGIGGDLERNVRAVMELARIADDGRVLRTRLPGLHERAAADIEIALQPFGYYRPVIEKDLVREGDRWIARYAIDPGPPVLVRRAEVELSGQGASVPAFQNAVRDFPLEKGDTLRHFRYETGKLVLLGVAADSGYLRAAFDSSIIRVDPAASSADIHLEFDTGPRYQFGPVRFQQDILDEGFLRSRIPFRRGEPFRQDRLIELQSNLADDPYFERVEVIPERDSAVGLEVPIRVLLVPARPRTYEIGVGYGTDTGPQGRLEATIRRINRRGHHARGEVTVATVEQSFSGQYMIPAVTHRTGILTLFAGYGRLAPRHSTSRAFATGARLFRSRFGWRETLSLSYLNESFEVGVDSTTGQFLIGAGTWERTRADDPGYPTRGLRTRFGVQGSSRSVIGATSFLQFTASAKAVYGLGSRLRVIPRAELGRTFTGAFRRLPPTLRFFTGGDQSVRGFGYLDLGSLDSLGNVIGGPALVVGSLELDYRVLPRWAVAVFTDVGNASERLSLADLEQGAGLGIRFISPFGLIRVDGAFGISRPGPPFRLHFSIGPDL